MLQSKVNSTDLLSPWYRSPRAQRQDSIEAILAPVHAVDQLDQLRLETVKHAEMYKSFSADGTAMSEFLDNVIKLLKE